jgi:hypothetical protein
MRFRRWPKPSAFLDTSRKRAALARSQQNARERLPLLAPLIAEAQPPVDVVMAQRAVHWTVQQRADRDRRALNWRRARQAIAGRDAPTRALLYGLWRDCPYPADPVYLLDLLHAIDTGRIDPARPSWTFHHKIEARVTRNPATFADAFKQIGSRKVGGGPKTTTADELTFCGNLGSGIIFLISRVRLMEPFESFYTSAPHRLRDSHVGRSGHWVDIEVRGECSDADLALIQRLAQAADARPIRVHRHSRDHAVPPPPVPAPPRRLLILACSARKRPGAGLVPARDRYDGPLWQTLRAADPHGRLAEVTFLSARFGFRAASTPIGAYDARLTPDIAARMIAGGLATRWPRPASPNRPDNVGVHPGHEIASLSRYGEAPFEEVAIAGGELYLNVMRALVGMFRGAGHISTDAPVTEINGTIGRMQQDLRAWLRSASSLPSPNSPPAQRERRGGGG